jgi:3-phosphoshikimate 1-carboxyvinyltransferase
VGQEFSSNLIGDESLSGRPMGRIIMPLSQMGANISSNANETPPLQISGSSKLKAIHYDLPIASAQVKSSILLAGLYVDGITSLTEPAITRDHTERMLISMGANLTKLGNKISIEGKPKIFGCDVNVPADLSSASFVILAAVLSEDSDILIKNVGINPTRIGVLEILKSMGADITLEKKLMISGEPVADIRVKSSKLKGSDIDPKLVSLAIDEFPVLFVAAASSVGKTTFSGIGELRVKESDRIAAMSKGLQDIGIKVDEYPDGAVIHGGKFSGGLVRSYGDHRIAMSLAIAGTVADDQIIVKDIDSVDTSFPGFCECMVNIGADIRIIEAA